MKRMAKRRNNNDWMVIKLIITVLAILVVVLFAGSLSSKSYVDISDQATVDLIKADGTTKHFDSIVFDLTNKGDELNVVINLPMEDKVDDGVICFFLYHTVLTATYEDEVLYSDGQEIADKNGMVGAQYIQIKVPEEAWGSSINVNIKVCEDSAFARIESIHVYPAIYSYRFFIDGNELNLILSLVGMVASLVVIAISFVTKKKGTSIARPICIALFTGIICLYLFTQHGSYELFSKAHYWADVEFLSLFSCGVPLLGYIVATEKEKKIRIALISVSILNTIFIGVCIVLHLANVYHYSVTLMFSHVFLVVDALLISGVTTHHLRENKPSSRILMIGCLLLVFFSITDIIRFNITKYLSFMNMNLPSILPIGIMVFVVTLGLSYYEDTINDRAHSNELEQQLALQLEHYRGVEEKNSEISTYRHDMKNHLVVIDSLIKEGDNEKALSYLSELNVALNNKGNLIDTKNPILDAILTQKKEIATSKGIKFHDDVHIEPNLKIDALDICKIFGNLLDNALEACERETGDSDIAIQLTMRGTSLIAKIDNTSSNMPKEDSNDGYVTHKKDSANHGYGIKSVKTSVAKYNGIVNFSWKDKRFYALVMLQDVGGKS